MKKRIGTVDLLVGVAVLIIGAALLLVFFMTKKPGNRVIVSIDGKETSSYPLDQDLDTQIDGVGGKNRLIIQDGEARITEADCPDKLCVKQGAVSHVGESIICLPHRVSVHIAGEDDEDMPDAVVR